MNTYDLRAEDVEELVREMKDVAKQLDEAKLEGARLEVSSAAAEAQADEAQKLLEAVR